MKVANDSKDAKDKPKKPRKPSQPREKQILPDKKLDQPWLPHKIASYVCPTQDCKKTISDPHNRKHSSLSLLSLSLVFTSPAAHAGECKLNGDNPGYACIHCVVLASKVWRCSLCALKTENKRKASAKASRERQKQIKQIAKAAADSLAQSPPDVDTNTQPQTIDTKDTKTPTKPKSAGKPQPPPAPKKATKKKQPDFDTLQGYPNHVAGSEGSDDSEDSDFADDSDHSDIEVDSETEIEEESI